MIKYLQMYIYIYIHFCLHIHKYTFLHFQNDIFQVSIYIYIDRYIYLLTEMFNFIFTYVYLFTFLHVYIYTNIIYIYIYIYIYLHKYANNPFLLNHYTLAQQLQKTKAICSWPGPHPCSNNRMNHVPYRALGESLWMPCRESRWPWDFHWHILSGFGSKWAYEKRAYSIITENGYVTFRSRDFGVPNCQTNPTLRPGTIHGFQFLCKLYSFF